MYLMLYQGEKREVKGCDCGEVWGPKGRFFLGARGAPGGKAGEKGNEA